MIPLISARNIPAVLGVGYAARKEEFGFNCFHSLGPISNSEQDLHVFFQKLCCRCSQVESLSEQVRTLFSRAAHKQDVKFSHFVHGEEKQADSLTIKSTVRVTTQLQTAQSATETYSTASWLI
jgi:hypothetical protein